MGPVADSVLTRAETIPLAYKDCGIVKILYQLKMNKKRLELNMTKARVMRLFGLLGMGKGWEEGEVAVWGGEGRGFREEGMGKGEADGEERTYGCGGHVNGSAMAKWGKFIDKNRNKIYNENAIIDGQN
ncbi:hypothetical protein PoB_001056700 [Plakobranchus ocellatus]|uniref:Uncharacterized protein n=1 Tax=Plakobranchus ocellatus TaxID=259542 RepID=A0AAV3YMA3_9GAST|nr:hypothetical protein PoB_001056700 [Plakobranchus ocellatus]